MKYKSNISNYINKILEKIVHAFVVIKCDSIKRNALRNLRSKGKK